jgi:hypothetical protein
MFNGNAFQTEKLIYGTGRRFFIGRGIKGSVLTIDNLISVPQERRLSTKKLFRLRVQKARG